MKRIGIIGGSGYAGAEAIRLVAAHPELELAWATGDSQAGTAVADLYPGLRAAYGDLSFTAYDPAHVDGLDAVVLALPHGKSQEIVPDLLGRVAHVVDVAADFRLKDPKLYDTWYGETHQCPQLLDKAVYGIPELGHRQRLKGAALIAGPGCYPTAASLALAPLVKHGVIEPTGIIVDAGCGVSGAGRTLKHGNLYGTVAENYEAYGLLTHRHTPEMEQNIGGQVLFTPHLLPMTRGILATCYARPTSPTSDKALLALLRGVYADEAFVHVIDGSPATKATYGTNVCLLTARFDERTGYVVVLSAIDNLVKGTAGAAVQCLNLALGLPETMGLPITAVYP